MKFHHHVRLPGQQADSLGFEEELRASARLPRRPSSRSHRREHVFGDGSADQGAPGYRVWRAPTRARVVVTGCYATRRPDEIRELSNLLCIVRMMKPRLVPICDGRPGVEPP